MFTDITVTLVFLGIWFWLYQKWARPPNFPPESGPGPPILPFVGSFPFIATGGVQFKTLKKWRRKCGNIIGLKLASCNVVVLYDYAVIKEAFSQIVFSGRNMLKPFELIATKNKRGLTFSDGKDWEEQRRFTVKSLRDFGFGKESMEDLAHQDILELIKSLKSLCQMDQPISTNRRFSLPILNSLWKIVAGESIQIDDSKFQQIVDKIYAAMSGLNPASASFFIPALEEFAPELTGLGKFQRTIPELKALIQEYIDEHKETYQDNHMRDFMDVFIQHINSCAQDPSSSFCGQVGEENLLVGVLNLFIAGAEMTSSTLNWALYYLSHPKNFEIQKKLRNEIDNIVGHFRLPNLNDRQRMPYTEAVMLEVFRMSSLFPVGIPHQVTADTVFNGFKIPKGTVVFANFFDYHYDPHIWNDPDNFCPERFLLKNKGNGEMEIDKMHPPIIPFSIGKRACPAETLSRNNFFLFLTSLFQAFCITRDPNKSTKKVNYGLDGFFRFSPDFKVILQDRLKVLETRG